MSAPRTSVRGVPAAAHMTRRPGQDPWAAGRRVVYGERSGTVWSAGPTTGTVWVAQDDDVTDMVLVSVAVDERPAQVLIDDAAARLRLAEAVRTGEPFLTWEAGPADGPVGGWGGDASTSPAAPAVATVHLDDTCPAATSGRAPVAHPHLLAVRLLTGDLPGTRTRTCTCTHQRRETT